MCVQVADSYRRMGVATTMLRHFEEEESRHEAGGSSVCGRRAVRVGTGVSYVM